MNQCAEFDFVLSVAIASERFLASERGRRRDDSDIRSSPTSALSSPSGSTGGTLRIGGRRSRSKSPFRSFRWKRGLSRAEFEDEGKTLIFLHTRNSVCKNNSLSSFSNFDNIDHTEEIFVFRWF